MVHCWVISGTLTGVSVNKVFFFMCFFVNNQHRIIVEESTTGSAELEKVFEGNLRRIGQMVAILDTWEEPIYLSSFVGSVWSYD